MTYLVQPQANRRVPRFRLTDITPAVLQFQDGRRTPGELQVISRSGGLLFLSKPLDQGSVVKLMFQTHRGPVLGTAEMLIPVTCTQQPFRFVARPVPTGPNGSFYGFSPALWAARMGMPSLFEF